MVGNLYSGWQRNLGKMMGSLLGMLLFLLPLAAPLIAQNTGHQVEKKLTAETCHFYNESCAQSEEGCPGYQTCSKTIDNYAACIVTWTNTTKGGVRVSNKGCITYDKGCSQETCISYASEFDLAAPHKTISCCCFKNNCNSNFFWHPREPRRNETSTSRSPSPKQIHKDSGILRTVVLTLTGLVGIFIIIPLIFYFYRRQKIPNFHELPTVESTALAPAICSPLQQIHLIEVKARGRFGAVWKATHGREMVAVKIFPLQDKQSWISEKAIYSLPNMSHENVLHFIGVDIRGEGPSMEFWLLSTYQEHGSLFDYLKGHTLSWSELIEIGLSLSRGLAFLHSESTTKKDTKPAIAHRDFKTKNVLLKSNMTACIADFGLALAFYPGQTPGETHGQVGTRRYMAPEVLEGAITFHRDAFLPIDMYACALVLWEMVTRCTVPKFSVNEYRLPFEMEVGLHPTLDDMQECVVTHRRRPIILKSWLQHEVVNCVIQTIKESWDHDAEARLSASCVMERFLILRNNNTMKDL